MSTKQIRLAVIDHDRCKPKKCNQECKKLCPVNRTGKVCVDIEKSYKAAKISEELCIGCGACVRACPFGAIQIVNIPTQLEHNLVYTYGENSFKLYKLPIPKIGNILGFIGENGIGKSTLMKILSNEVLPNFGKYDNPPDHKEIFDATRGTELQNYLKLLYSNKLKIKTKPQNIDKLLVSIKKNKPSTTVKELISKHYKEGDPWHENIIDKLDIRIIFDNIAINISGGELQRVVCAIIMMQEADVYIFDEPTNYLDIKQRLNVADLIKELSKPTNYIFIVEHDLSILDYTSDLVCIMYGKPGAYGAISSPHSTGNAINMFFSGYIRADNMRFRQEAFSFKESLELQIEVEHKKRFKYQFEAGVIKYDNFILNISSGDFMDSSIIVLLGRNGTGKSTFLNYLATNLGLVVSYKTQYLDISRFVDKKTGKYPRVIEMLSAELKGRFSNALFTSDVINPMDIKRLYDRRLNKLSGGELQRVMIVHTLGQDANVYLFDEPSACLDVEQRTIITRVIKRFVMHHKRSCFVVEHDIMMAMSLSMERDSRIVVFDNNYNEETKTRETISSPPLHFSEGINKFLKQMGITFRTDQTTRRPRINKIGSSKDSEQKRDNKYYE